MAQTPLPLDKLEDLKHVVNKLVIPVNKPKFTSGNVSGSDDLSKKLADANAQIQALYGSITELEGRYSTREQQYQKEVQDLKGTYEREIVKLRDAAQKTGTAVNNLAGQLERKVISSAQEAAQITQMHTAELSRVTSLIQKVNDEYQKAQDRIARLEEEIKSSKKPSSSVQVVSYAKSAQDTTKLFVDWAIKNTTPEYANPRVPFVSYDLGSGKQFDIQARIGLYLDAGIPMILNASTGVGKTTFAEHLAAQRELYFHKYSPPKHIKALKNLLFEPVIGQNEQYILFPTPLTKFLIFGGMLFLDEIANLSPNVLVELHDLLQGRSIEAMSHLGPVSLTPGQGTHIILAAGNFRYQKPAFSRATIQRFGYGELPELSDDLKDKLRKGKVPGLHDHSFYDELERNTHPWFYERGRLQLNPPYPWEKHYRDSDKKKDVYSKMLTEIAHVLRVEVGDKFTTNADINLGLDFRVMALFSQKMDDALLVDTIREQFLYPILIEQSESEGTKDPTRHQKQEIINKVTGIVLKYARELGLKQSGVYKPQHVYNKMIDIFNVFRRS